MLKFKQFAESVPQEQLLKNNVYFDENNSRWGIPPKVNSALGGATKIVGVADPKTSVSRAPLFFAELDSYDRSQVSGVRLKQGQQIFRYATETSAASGIVPYIKVDIYRGMVYFLTERSTSGETDDVEFETRGVKVRSMRFLLSIANKHGII